MSLSPFQLFVWIAGFIAEVAVLVVLFVRHRAKVFPFFTTFIACEVAFTAIEFFDYRYRSYRTYLYTNWTLGILDEVLQLFVFYEIAVHVFRPTGVWAADVRKTFLELIAACSIVSLLLSCTAHPLTHFADETFKMRSDFFSALLMSELFVISVALSVLYGLPWKTHVARIAQGLGAFSIISLAAYIAKIYIGLDHRFRPYRVALENLINCTFFVCETYWIVMLWAEAPAPRELPEAMRNQIYILQRQVENDLMRIRSWRRS